MRRIPIQRVASFRWSVSLHAKNEPAAVAVRGKALSHGAQGINRGDGAEGLGEIVGVGRR